MKKIKLLTVLVLTINYANAQYIESGLMLSKLNWNNTDVYNKLYYGYSINVGMDYFNSKHFNLFSSVGILKKGGRGEFYITDEFGNINTTLTINKININYSNINTGFNIKTGTNIKTYFKGGIYSDLLISNDDDIKELKMYAIGLITGLGLSYNINSFSYGINFNYYYGLTDITPGYNIKINSYLINFKLTYDFRH